jgi:hypothetical protein
MGYTQRQEDVRQYRGQIPSPGRPTVAWREDRVRFWAAVARGAKTEDACVEAGVSGPVGFRWFRHAGGVNPCLVRCRTGRALRARGAEAMTTLLEQLRQSLTWDRGQGALRARSVHRRDRHPRVFRRPPQSLATRDQRKRQWPAAAILPQGHRPIAVDQRRPPSRRRCPQQQTPQGPRLEDTSRGIPGTATISATNRWCDDRLNPVFHRGDKCRPGGNPGGGAVFRLERGVTGFGDQKGPELPATDIRTFRAACYAAARAAEGSVDRITERTYPRNFHSAVFVTPNDPYTILCQGYYPLIAFVHHGTGSWASPGVFMDPPTWAGVFADMGFTLMSRRLLDSPLSEVDTTALTAADWTQIRSWRPVSLGKTLFNSWD